MNDPDEPQVDELVRAAATAIVPDEVLAAVAGADRPEAGPAAGELWRARAAGDGPVTLVWLRSVTPTEAVAVPVSFDVEQADEETLVVPAEASPLGLALALHVRVETAIDRETLLDRLGTFDVTTIETRVGPTIVSPLDERIEYRQALVDAMAELAPAVAGEADGEQEHDVWWPPEVASDGAGVLVALHEALAASHPAARVSPRPAAAGSEAVRAVAQVAELDAFVLVAFLLDGGLEEPSLLEAAREVLQADQLLNAVCLVEPVAPFVSIVIDRRDVVEAIETPSGQLRPPRRSRPPTPVGEALTKFLDAAISPFGRLASTVVEAEALDPRGLAVDVASEAVRSVEASARGFKVEGKRPGYERVTRHRDSIVRLVEEALNSPDVDVASILEDDG